MTSKREYLISLGLARAGRGKFSKAGNDAIAKAIADGMTFDEPAIKVKAEKPVKSVTENNNLDLVKSATPIKDKSKPLDTRAKTIERPVARNFGGLLVEAAPRYLHDNYVATDLDGSKIKRGYKEVCNGCGYSCRWCLCASGPTIFSCVDSSVSLRLATVGKVSA